MGVEKGVARFRNTVKDNLKQKWGARTRHSGGAIAKDGVKIVSHSLLTVKLNLKF